MSALELRDYQQEAITGLRRGLMGGNNRQLLIMPTGSGKTEVACGLIESVAEKGGKTLFIVDRLTLKDQGADRFRGYSFQVGVIQGENTDYRADDDVHVATAQTLASRMKKSPLSLDCQLIVIDEAHVLFEAHRVIFDLMDKTPVIGLTATPHHRELGKWYSNMVTGSTTAKMIEQKQLVPFRVFHPAAQVDTKGLKMTAADFNTKELGERVQAITGDVVANWQANGEDRITLAFCVNVSHAEELAYEFNQAGVPAAWIYFKTPDDERAELFKQLREGTIRVLCSVTALTAGFDMPCASCTIVARPTASESLHIQMLGRGARPYPDKVDHIVFDHAGNCERHGLPQDYIPPTLEQVEQRSSPKREPGEKTGSSCENCEAMLRARERICAECGHERDLASKVYVIAGQLTEVGKDLPDEVQQCGDFRHQFLAELKGWVAGRKKKNGEPYNGKYPSRLYQQRFKNWPSDDGIQEMFVSPIQPGAAVERWIRNEQKRANIAYRAGRRA